MLKRSYELEVPQAGGYKPLAFHFNSRIWRAEQQTTIKQLFDSIETGPWPDSERAPDLDIIVCNSNPTPGMAQICLDRRGVPYHWLGRGVSPWVNARKILLCVEFLQRSAARYTMQVDAPDVVVRGSPREILERFLRANCDMLFAAETYFHFHECPGFGSGPVANLGYEIRAHQRASYEKGAFARASFGCECPLHIEYERDRQQYGASCGSYVYLNAGCWIGRTEFVRHAIGNLLGVISKVGVFYNEQPYMHMLHHEHHPRVQIDSTCSIFQCGSLCHDEDFLI